MVKLFEKVSFRGVDLKSRIVVSPMGMYSAENGYVPPFHVVHYGKFAAIQINHGGRKCGQQHSFRGNGPLTDCDLQMGEPKFGSAGFETGFA